MILVVASTSFKFPQKIMTLSWIGFIPEVVVSVRKDLRLERYTRENEEGHHDRWIFCQSGNFPPTQSNTFFLGSYDVDTIRPNIRSS